MVNLDRLLRLGNLSCAYRVSCLNIPEVSTRWVRASEKGIRKIDLVARNNGARQTVYRLEGSTQELGYDVRKVAEHMTMAGNELNKIT